MLFITGGSRGIGAAIATLAGSRGYHVAVNFVRDESAAQRVVDAIVATGGRAMAVGGDVAVEKDIVRMFTEAESHLGALTALVNNAGITGAITRVADISAEMLTRVFAVNAIGPILCAREAVQRLSTSRGGNGGSIINISSQAARYGSAGEWVHYAASKGAIDSMTIGLAREVASEGIRVNAVSPGFIDTEIHAASGDPGRLQRAAGRVPLARVGMASEVAEAVLWLLSPAASYVTGAIVPVSGGL